MGTDTHTVLQGGASGGAHRLLVSRMAAARDMGRGDKTEEGALDSDTGGIIGLADVGVEIYGTRLIRHGDHPPRRRRGMSRAGCVVWEHAPHPGWTRSH